MGELFRENATVVRKLILEDLDTIRACLLTEHLVSVLTLINLEKNMTSGRLSIILDISPQNASAKLTKLFTKGYLVRKEVTSETGGIEYVYKLPCYLGGC